MNDRSASHPIVPRPPPARTRFVEVLSRLAHLSIRIVKDLLAPPTCAACDAPLAKLSIFCSACASTFAQGGARRVGLVEVFSGAAYGGSVAAAIKRFKYGARPDLAEPLAHLVRRQLSKRAPAVDVVVPVPLHPRRLAERGFNQAGLLARFVARDLDVPFAARALERTRFSAPQASLGKRERGGNLRGAFRVRESARLEGARVAVVDDVVTTGATLTACSEALLDAGATSIVGIVVADTPTS